MHNMNKDSFLEKLNTTPDSISFQDTMSIIDSYYNFTPTEFKNGDLLNQQDQNNGSCKIFSFAQLNTINEEQTLHCFGDYYRKDVLENPQGDDHQNIRNFMKNGWAGISFTDAALTEK